MSHTPTDPLDQLAAHWQSQPTPPGPSADLRARTQYALAAATPHIVAADASPWTARPPVATDASPWVLPNPRAARPRRRIAPALTAAALFLLAALLLLLFPTTTPTIAFADVLQQVQSAKTVTWKSPGGHHTFYLKGDRRRWEGDDQAIGGIGPYVTIEDLKTGQSLTVNRDPDNTYAQLDRRPPSVVDPYSVLKSLAQHATLPLGPHTIDGRKLVGFTGQIPTTQPDGKVVPVTQNVWIDPDTRLPVRIENVDLVTGRTHVAMTDIRFDVPLDDALFDLTPPNGIRLIVNNPLPLDQIKTPDPTKLPNLVLHVGAGLGDLKLGDPPDRVSALFGQPDQPVPNYHTVPHRYVYAALGLEIIVQPSQDDLHAGKWKDLATWRVDSIWCRSANSSPFPTRDFPGHTDEGIHFGSTRDDVLAAYGEPDFNNAQNMDYGHKGLLVTLLPDATTVTGLTVVIPDNPTTLRSIAGFNAAAARPTTAPSH